MITPAIGRCDLSSRVVSREHTVLGGDLLSGPSSAIVSFVAKNSKCSNLPRSQQSK